MRIIKPMLVLACTSALGTAALAQDSVSRLNALPGDAVDAYNTNEQINDYVVDETVLTTSWGTTFGIAPLAKSSAQRQTGPTFYTSLINAQGMSRKVASGVPFLRNQYSLWTAAGSGINDDPTRNNPGAPVSTIGATGFQFGFGFAEFGDGNPAGTSLANAIGGVVNFLPTQPSRLFVSRITAGTNAPGEGCALAAFGVGAVDEEGSIDFRADNFGATNTGCPTFGIFTGNNYFRVRGAARTTMQNVISTSFPLGGDAAATDWVLANSTVTYNTPNLIPRSMGSTGVAIVIGSNFNKQYAFGSTTVVADAPAAHLAGLADHRATVAYSSRNFSTLFPGSLAGTGAILAKSSAASTAFADNLAIWGLDGTGQFVAPIARALPAVGAISDADQPAWNSGVLGGSEQFDHYHSQTAFQGGSAQVALGQDQAGNLLAAAVVYYGFTPPDVLSEPNNYIAVSKTDPLTGTTTWSVAAWTEGGSGKNIYQNGTTVIGNLRPFGTAPTFTGPALSAPMIDSVGNVWFISSFERTSAPGVVSVGLFRAVLQPATFSYKLELVLAQGDVFAGRNSARNYQIGFITLDDSDSISSGTAFSGNISEVAFENQSTTGLSTSDARTLGGIVISANVIYDNNGDGQFIKSTGTGGTAGSPDEDYNVLLYIGAAHDCNANGIPDDREIADGSVADTNNNGIPDSCEGFTGTPFCFGDSLGTNCPCSNNTAPGAGTGCLSSLGVGGKLAASGTASISSDSLVLTGTQMPNSSVLYFQGTTQLNAGNGVPFGDGLRCAGGSIIRLKTLTNVGGGSTYPSGALPHVSVKGLVTSPGSRTYQAWYRNAATFCTASTFNLTNGVLIAWTM